MWVVWYIGLCFVYCKWPLFYTPYYVDVEKALMDGIMYAAARNPFCFDLPREVLLNCSSMTISTPVMQWILNAACLCVCVCMRVCLLDMESLSHECCCSQLSYEWSPLGLMTDTRWPLLRMDVWLLTHFWLPLYWFFFSSPTWPFQTYSILEGYI